MLRFLFLLLFVTWTTHTSAEEPGAPSSSQEATPAEFSTSSTSWEGLSEFIRLAERHIGAERIKIRATLDYEKVAPTDAIVILHPEVKLDSTSLSRFLTAGGRLALCDDFGQGKQFLEPFGVRRTRPPLDPAQRLNDNPALAIATPVTRNASGEPIGKHPMTEQVEQVMTNHAAALENPNLTPVLEIVARDGTSLPLALTGVIAEKGRLVVIGDPSIFINLMLRYPGNRAFAEGLLEYLLVADRPSLEGNLWIVSGAFKQEGYFGGRSLEEDLKHLLDRLEKNLAQLKTEGLPSSFTLLLAALLAIWIARAELGETLKRTKVGQPSFARPPSIAGQVGLLARAEVLSAPATPAPLALLELSSALEEALQHYLDIPAHLGANELAARLLDSPLSESDRGALLALHAELRFHGKRIAEGRPKRASERDLKRIHGEVMRLLSIIQSTGRQQLP